MKRFLAPFMRIYIMTQASDLDKLQFVEQNKNKHKYKVIALRAWF